MTSSCIYLGSMSWHRDVSHDSTQARGRDNMGIPAERLLLANLGLVHRTSNAALRALTTGTSSCLPEY